MVSRILTLSLPSAVLAAYQIASAPVSLDDFKTEYNLNLPDETTAVKILTLNNLIRGTNEPTGSGTGDANKLWAWYAGVTDATVKASAKAFLEKVETDHMVNEQMLTSFNTGLQTALTQATAPGKVTIDAKNYAAIFGDVRPSVDPTTGIRQGAQDAYDAFQTLDSANQAKAKTLAEARLYGSWTARFKTLRDTNQFTGTDGFKHIVQCMRDVMQTSAPSDDSNGGESGWQVYHRVSAANKKLIKDAIVAQMALSVSAV